MTEIPKRHFKLKDIDEAKCFDNSLDEFYKNNSHYITSTPYLKLEKWFNYSLKNKEEGGRIFTSILDIKLNFIFLDIEMTNAHNNWAKLPKEGQAINILNDFTSFSYSIKVLQEYSNYVFRYRAIWDKVMGLLVLLYSPSDYKKYLKGRKGSRKTMFRKIMENTSNPFSLPAKHIVALIEAFDNEFRTPEAHGTGVLRKWVLDPSTLSKIAIDDPNLKLNLDYWNSLITIFNEIEKQIFPA